MAARKPESTRPGDLLVVVRKYTTSPAVYARPHGSSTLYSPCTRYGTETDLGPQTSSTPAAPTNSAWLAATASSSSSATMTLATDGSWAGTRKRARAACSLKVCLQLRPVLPACPLSPSPASLSLHLWPGPLTKPQSTRARPQSLP